MIAGLVWVAAHRERYGIRVVNVSYGSDSSQKWLEDPLNEAVQRLGEAGVLVVAGAGNAGDGGPARAPGWSTRARPRAALDRSFAARPANQGVPSSTGLGKLDSSRGSAKPYPDSKESGKPEQLSGEFDARAQPWDGAAFAAREWSAAAWRRWDMPPTL